MRRQIAASVIATTFAMIGVVLAQPAQTGTQGQTAPPATQTPPPLPAPPKPTPTAVPFPADAKIAFVNIQGILGESKLGKQGQEEMKKFADPLDTLIKAKQKEGETLASEIQSQSNLLQAAALNAKRQKLEELGRELEYMQKNRDAKVQTFNNELVANFEAKVMPILETMRAEKKLWVIFTDQGGEGGLSVVSYEPGLDLTIEVIKRLDAMTPPKAATPPKTGGGR